MVICHVSLISLLALLASSDNVGAIAAGGFVGDLFVLVMIVVVLIAILVMIRKKTKSEGN